MTGRRTPRRTHSDWLRYDPEASRLVVTDLDGKVGHYCKGLHLEERGGWDLKVVFAGGVIGLNEAALRSLPTRIVLRRTAENSLVAGVPLKGAIDARFDYVRMD
jgi:hypothetical protein